jgi:hypothetical protein
MQTESELSAYQMLERGQQPTAYQLYRQISYYEDELRKPNTKLRARLLRRMINFLTPHHERTVNNDPANQIPLEDDGMDSDL